MSRHCSWSKDENLATITMNSGKVNAFSHELIQDIHQCLDEVMADAEIEAIVLTGQAGIFSAGFDLKVMKAGPKEAQELITAGGKLLSRLYLLERPLIIACSGHAMAMGAITLFVGDFRLSCSGDFKIGLNESSIGIALPHLAIALAKDRIPKTMQSRAIVIGEIFDGEGAKEAGYLDQVTTPEQLLPSACDLAKNLGRSLDLKAFAENKKRLRQSTLESVAGIWH